MAKGTIEYRIKASKRMLRFVAIWQRSRNPKRWLTTMLCVGATIGSAARAQSTTAELIPYLDANGQYGFADSSGKLVIPAQYTAANRFSEGRAAVASGDKWGYIDEAGRWVVKPTYTSAEDYANGEAIARVFVDSTNKGGPSSFLPLPSFGDAILPWRHDAYSKVYRFDLSGRLLGRSAGTSKRESGRGPDAQLPIGVMATLKLPAYRGAHAMMAVPPLYPVAIGCTDRTTGCDITFLSAEGQVLSTSSYSSYDGILGFQNDRLRVIRDGKYGFVDSHGAEVIPARYDNVEAFDDGYAVAYEGGRGVGVIDAQGQLVVDFGQGDQVFSDLRYPANGLFVGRRKSGWGILDVVNHREIVPFIHESLDDVRILHEGSTELALAVRDESKVWCLLDRQGNTLRCGYTDVWGAHENVIAVKEPGGLWGAVDSHGQTIVPARYGSSFTFSQGMARVKNGKHTYYIDTHGKEYVSPILVKGIESNLGGTL